MALKGISWIEQNCEKLVVGVFGVGLLGVVAMQFVGVSSQVTLVNGKDKKTVPVEEALTQVGSQAKVINEVITNPDPVELRDMKENLPTEAGVLQTFQSKLGNVAPRPTLVAALDKPRTNFVGGGAGAAQDPASTGARNFMYAAISAPAVSTPVGVSYLATIHPAEYAKDPAILKILPANPKPKDKASVSLEAAFDGVAFAEMLSQDPDGEGPLSQLPPHWWGQQNTQVLAVELERQEQKPDGSWTEATKVQHMPGRVDLSAQIETVAANGPEALKSLMADATAQASDIRHPKYYDIIFGEEWVMPSEAIAILAADVAAPVDGAVDDATRAKQGLASLDAKIVNIHDQIAKQHGPDGKVTPPKGPSGGGKRPAGPTSGPTTKDPKADTIKRLEAKLAQLEKEREQYIERYTRRGIILEAEPKTPEADQPETTTEKAVAELPLLENPAAKIVAHDVTVERGKTYRYRISLVFNNPIYGKVVASDPDQEKLTKMPTVRGTASEWSEPIAVDAESYYFITSASPQDALSRSSRAGAEVYIFRWGYWRKGSLSIEPGDILATDVKVPDFTKQLALMTAPTGPNGQPLPPGAAQPPVPPDGGGRGRIRGPASELPTPPPAPGGVKTEDAVTYSQEPVSHEAVMLEVALTAVMIEQGGSFKSRTENHVYLRDNDGTIVTRVPDADRSSGWYRKLDSSAKKGDEAVKARNAPPVDPAAPDPRRPGIDPPPPPGGGGGGGGGG
ncbi:MAG: hypothetical protein H7210_14320 [Pyrinomonadaceae bacterium]|nr:hypothetical protein [Phycisphaerales bacterium]